MNNTVLPVAGKPKPPNAGKGRVKGVPNKTTTTLKEAILAAAEQYGEDGAGRDGLVGYLRKVAGEDVKAFASLLGRVLPLQLDGHGSLTITIAREDGRFL